MICQASPYPWNGREGDYTSPLEGPRTKRREETREKYCCFPWEVRDGTKVERKLGRTWKLVRTFFSRNFAHPALRASLINCQLKESGLHTEEEGSFILSYYPEASDVSNYNDSLFARRWSPGKFINFPLLRVFFSSFYFYPSEVPELLSDVNIASRSSIRLAKWISQTNRLLRTRELSLFHRSRNPRVDFFSLRIVVQVTSLSRRENFHETPNDQVLFCVENFHRTNSGDKYRNPIQAGCLSIAREF